MCVYRYDIDGFFSVGVDGLRRVTSDEQRAKDGMAAAVMLPAVILAGV